MFGKLNNKAFTLIELIVVIVIIGILVLLAAPKFLSHTKDARIAQIQNDVKAYETAIETELVKGEANNVDKLDEWGWITVEREMFDSYLSESTLFDKKGLATKLGNGVIYQVNKDDVPIKSNLKGDLFYVGGKVYYHQNDGNNNEKENIPEGFTLLTDDDFEFVKDSNSPNSYIVDGEVSKGYFHYKGEADNVIIPYKIMENEVKDYYQMFYFNGHPTWKVGEIAGDNGTAVTAVISDNPQVTDMFGMFRGSKATTLDLSNFNTSNVTDMSSMFNGSQATVLDLSPFDTSNVTDMARMFYDSQATALNLSSFDTSNVTNMENMFRNSKATTLDLSNFDTSNVTDMFGMFRGSKATTLDLSNFNTSNVTDMRSMFNGSQATIGYARTQEDANRFNNSSGKPSELTFKVK